MNPPELQTVEQSSRYPGTADIPPEMIARWRERHDLPADPSDVLRPDRARRTSVPVVDEAAQATIEWLDHTLLQNGA